MTESKRPRLSGLIRGQALRVHWRDAYSNPGWHAPHDYDAWARTTSHVLTVGTYIDHDRRNMHLAQSIRGDRVADVIEIPLSLIDRLEKLK